LLEKSVPNARSENEYQGDIDSTKATIEGNQKNMPPEAVALQELHQATADLKRHESPNYWRLALYVGESTQYEALSLILNKDAIYHFCDLPKARWGVE
jgi:hypothetical protein